MRRNCSLQPCLCRVECYRAVAFAGQPTVGCLLHRDGGAANGRCLIGPLCLAAIPAAHARYPSPALNPLHLSVFRGTLNTRVSVVSGNPIDEAIARCTTTAEAPIDSTSST